MLLRVMGSAVRELGDVLRAATPTHRRLRDHLVTIIVATVGVDLVCAVAALLLERHTQQTEVKTFGSAAFWTTTQLLTVSSQIKNPISAGGRLPGPGKRRKVPASWRIVSPDGAHPGVVKGKLFPGVLVQPGPV